jgi:hypothetical protein
MVKAQRFHSAALHWENYATIANYLPMELRYMDAGDEAQNALTGQGTPGIQEP